MATIPKEFSILPRAIDFKASVQPDGVYAYLPSGDRIEGGFRPLTWQQYAKAIDEIAWWLDDYLDGPVVDDEIPTVGYVGPNDVRYPMVIMAASKTKRQVMLPFPANTVVSQVNLLKNANCRYLVFGNRPSQEWIDTLAQLPNIKSVQLPDSTTFLHERPIGRYEFPKCFEEAYDDPFYTIQTSGTTGNPKPIVITNRNEMDYFDMHETNRLAPLDSKLAIQEMFEDSYLPLLLPYSWIAGIMPLLRFPLNSNLIPVLMPSTMPQPMTAAYVKEAILAMPRGNKNGLFLTPDTLKEIALDESILTNLRNIDWVGYAGAPLDHTTGDTIAKYTRVQSLIGSTDTGCYPILVNPRQDWKLLRFHPSLLGWHLEPFSSSSSSSSSPDLFELCIHRQPHDPRYCFLTNPSISVYHTKDLFRAVPGREGYYTTAGRLDDFVKLSTMTKFSATAIEQIIDLHPKIRKSLVGGDARERSFAIVQPKEYAGKSDEEILEEVWPGIERANEGVFGEARISRELVLVAEEGRGIKTTAKGSVDRRTTVGWYEGRIEGVYRKAGFGGSGW